MSRYDVIVVGAGHNGLTAACYLAKRGLRTLVLERSDHIGGAAVSSELYPGWTYSNCSYVCSLLRPEVVRDLDLPRHGLHVIPYEILPTFQIVLAHVCTPFSISPLLFLLLLFFYFFFFLFFFFFFFFFF